MAIWEVIESAREAVRDVMPRIEWPIGWTWLNWCAIDPRHESVRTALRWNRVDGAVSEHVVEVLVYPTDSCDAVLLRLVMAAFKTIAQARNAVN